MSTSHYFKLPSPSIQDAPPEYYGKGKPVFVPKRGFRAWAATLWSLVLHSLVAISILILMVYYVDGRHFNVIERRPWVPLAGGTTFRLSRYVPLQSDVTTLISSALVVLRLIAGAWITSLYWRSAFFLMERPGLKRQDLDWMISYGFFTPRAYRSHVIMFRVGMILLATLSAQFVSPILTGSISWVPSSRLAGLNSDLAVNVSVATPDWWGNYADSDSTRRLWTARQATGVASYAWGRRAERGVQKRVLRSTDGLNINSTITNVTLPYFSITSLEWITDPLSTLPPNQLNISKIRDDLGRFEESSPINVRGMCAFIPDAPVWDPTTFPSPSNISETRTVILYTHWLPEGTCRPDNAEMFSQLPTNLGFVKDGSICYAFARVTYSAGAGVCANCRVSSHMTVQNDTTIMLQEDSMTTEALRLMAYPSVLLVQMNTSIPSTHGPIDDYVAGLLARSYSGSWTALTNYLGRPAVPLTSSFSASLPSLQAQVDLKRVYAWLAVQMLVPLCGIVFLKMQSVSKYRLIGDTTLAAFDLETSELTSEEGRQEIEAGRPLKLEPKAGGLKVAIRTSRTAVNKEQVRRATPIN